MGCMVTRRSVDGKEGDEEMEEYVDAIESLGITTNEVRVGRQGGSCVTIARGAGGISGCSCIRCLSLADLGNLCHGRHCL